MINEHCQPVILVNGLGDFYVRAHRPRGSVSFKSIFVIADVEPLEEGILLVFFGVYMLRAVWCYIGDGRTAKGHILPDMKPEKLQRKRDFHIQIGQIGINREIRVEVLHIIALHAFVEPEVGLCLSATSYDFLLRFAVNREAVSVNGIKESAIKGKSRLDGGKSFGH